MMQNLPAPTLLLFSSARPVRGAPHANLEDRREDLQFTSKDMT